MYGNNLAFTADPFGYAKQRAINPMAMGVSNEQGLVSPAKHAFNFIFGAIPAEDAARMQVYRTRTDILQNLDRKGKGKFDLEPVLTRPHMVAFRACSRKRGPSRPDRGPRT